MWEGPVGVERESRQAGRQRNEKERGREKKRGKPGVWAVRFRNGVRPQHAQPHTAIHPLVFVFFLLASSPPSLPPLSVRPSVSSLSALVVPPLAHPFLPDSPQQAGIALGEHESTINVLSSMSLPPCSMVGVSRIVRGRVRAPAHPPLVLSSAAVWRVGRLRVVGRFRWASALAVRTTPRLLSITCYRISLFFPSSFFPPPFCFCFPPLSPFLCSPLLPLLPFPALLSLLCWSPFASYCVTCPRLGLASLRVSFPCVFSLGKDRCRAMEGTRVETGAGVHTAYGIQQWQRQGREGEGEEARAEKGTRAGATAKEGRKEGGGEKREGGRGAVREGVSAAAGSGRLVVREQRTTKRTGKKQHDASSRRQSPVRRGEEERGRSAVARLLPMPSCARWEDPSRERWVRCEFFRCRLVRARKACAHASWRAYPFFACAPMYNHCFGTMQPSSFFGGARKTKNEKKKTRYPFFPAHGNIRYPCFFSFVPFLFSLSPHQGAGRKNRGDLCGRCAMRNTPKPRARLRRIAAAGTP